MPRRFANAPAWYRPVLAARNWAAIRTRGLRPPPTPPAAAPSAELDLAASPLLGIPIPERVMPGAHMEPVGFVHHLSRYVWAIPHVNGQRVVDLGCGTGYGSYLLSWAAESVTGVDRSEDALAYARSHYRDVTYELADLTDEAGLPEGDVAVCFEVLEHLAEPQKVIVAALQAYPRVLFSFPNPMWGNSELNPHHLQDWPLRECRRRFRAAGAASVQVFSQRLRSGAVVRGYRPLAASWLFLVSRLPRAG